MPRTITPQSTLSFLLVAGVAISPARAQDEFSYRDLMPSQAGQGGPLIPQAAQDLAPRPSLSRADSFQVPPAPRNDLIPIASASGSEAAQIYNRNKRRVGTINGIFQRLKDQARAREDSARMAEEEMRRQREEAELRAQEEKLRQEREAREQALELARREEEARRRFDEANRRQQELARQQDLRQQEYRQQDLRQQRAAAQTPPPIAQPAGATSASGAMASSYVVKPGDSLIKIARTVYGNSQGWTKIAAANGLDRNATIRVGDSLVIPNYQAPAPAPGKAQVRAAADNEPVLDYSKFDYKLYNIQPGDTLSGIAAKFYGDSQKYQLIEAYNSKALARGLRHGDKLLIPVQRSQAHKERYTRLMDEGVF